MKKPFSSGRQGILVSGLLGGLAAALAVPPAEGASARVAGFHIDRHLGGLGAVTALAFASDGTLFLTEKTGAIRVLPFGAGSPRAFATVGVYTNSECGLLGIALDPAYPGYGKGGFVYVFATVSGSEQRIIRFTDQNGTGADRTEVRRGLPTLGANHDGGCLRIGPDGKFYLAIGDGGSGPSKSQDPLSLFGKVLRLNLDGTAAADNPDLSALNVNYRREIYALGFRNPFRIALRPLGPGPQDFQVFINDVGSSGSARYEEVNRVEAGKNYGWPNAEGFLGSSSYTRPLHAYQQGGNSIVGGVFYQGSLFPAAYRGDYFYMDYGSNDIFRMVLNGDQLSSNAVFADAEGGLIDIAEGPDGALYYSTNNGQIFRIRYETPGNVRPTAALAAEPRSGEPPLAVSFDAGSSADADGSLVRYDWTFGDGTWVLDGGPQATHAYTRDGNFTARVLVTDDQGGAASATALIEVRTIDLPPVPEILAPDDGAAYDAGVTVQLSGRATDPDEGELAGDRLRWEVTLHHDAHTHPWLAPTPGAQASFDIPPAGLEENWSFRIKLTATDSANHAVSVERTVNLNYLPLALDTQPPGLRVTADGVSLTGPAAYQAVRKARVELGAPSPQGLPAGASGEGRYVFQGWSDGGAATHEVTAAAPLSLTASFAPDPRTLFIRGDSNRDGKVDLSDAVFSLSALFTGGALWDCLDSGDGNDDGTLDIADPIATLFALFADGRALPPPAASGFDPSADGLTCEGDGTEG